MKRKKVVVWVFVGLYIVFFAWYWRLPEYVECNSRVFAASNYRETTLSVVAYKARYNKFMYDEIAEKNNKMNGTSDKLVIHLYYTKRGLQKGKDPYRTIVYDYENHVKYILIEYIPTN